MRSPSGWTRGDSLVVLASYAARPPHLALPPPPEVERVASVLRMPVEVVRARMLRFAGHDPQNPTTCDEDLGPRDRRLWDAYRSDPMRLQADAEWAVQASKYRPRWLYGDDGSGP